MKWQLVVDSGRRKGQVIPLARSPFWIGRDASCHLRPAASSVVQRHCTLIVLAGSLFVYCDSAGESFVNGERIAKEVELHPGDRFRVGPLEFVIQGVEESRPSRSTLDEDSIGEMLLAMDEEEKALADGAVLSPSAATSSEVATLAARETESDLKAIDVRKPSSPSSATPRVETCGAASELLNQYVRRPQATTASAKR